ncbi:MAG TPA: hypothetical protein VLA13_03920 [Massilibacterium sp.]|nr:hypothetical protein [Massilibacterium sp.]
MGWCTGSEIAETIWEDIKPYIKKEDYRNVARIIYDEIDAHDADCWENYDGSLYSIAHPEEFLEDLKEDLTYYKENKEWELVKNQEFLISKYEKLI